MLNAFRNFTKSRYGLIIVFIFLGLLAIAFAASDVTGMRQGISGANSGTLATVGGQDVTEREVRDRIDRILRNAQAQRQPLTMAQLLAQGGFEAALNDTIKQAALHAFANQNGMAVGKKLIDSEIANNSQFAGMDGKFSQETFESLLAQNRINPAQFRDSMTTQRYAVWLVGPVALPAPAPAGVVTPYVATLLERRTGIVGFVQSLAMDPGPAPDANTLAGYYAQNRSRYMVPERRIVRFALAQPETLKAQATPTEAEIAAAYKKDAAKYAASEKRGLQLVQAISQSVAAKVAAAAKGGDLAAAAKAAGLEARTIDAADKAGIAKQVSAPFADAAFAAPATGLQGPVQLGGAWFVYRVSKVENIAARSLDQVRTELVDEVSKRKLAALMADLRQSIEDGVGDGATFEEAAAKAKLSIASTSALTAAGTNPDQADAQPDATTAAIMKAGFGFEQAGDEPQVIPVGQDGGFALVSLDKIVPAAPRPLAQITDKVKADYLLDQALAKARTAATAMLPKLQKGVPMAQALTEVGATKGAPPKPFDFKRSELRGKENFIQMAFDMPAKTARLVEAPNRAGYYVVYVDTIQAGNPAADPQGPQILQSITQALGQLSAQEYENQFAASVVSALKVRRNEAAIARLRADLQRQGAGGQ
ncbi:peptidylprolyl isomerase [Sphingomonas elodea]|uniref:peptidylprolyl isomerase n=1 Tax=Sphingomonas elodea TaxID=179878 RepID=UPI0002630399|nr:peptidylprolyl isomerase [Sphingomonas elodea]